MARYGAFAGLRTSEIFRLSWSHIKWDATDEHGKLKPVIAVPQTVARKVRISRIVAMSENLQAWLAPWRGATGQVYLPHDASAAEVGAGEEASERAGAFVRVAECAMGAECAAPFFWQPQTRDCEELRPSSE